MQSEKQEFFQANGNVTEINGSSIAVLQEEQTATGDTQHNVHPMAKAMREMQLRQLKRLRSGHFRVSPVKVVWTFVFVLTFITVVGICLWGISPVTFWVKNWKEMSLLTISFPFIVYIILKVSLLMKWVLYWLVLATAILFVLNSVDTNDLLAAQWLLIAFACIEFITVAVYYFSRNFDTPSWFLWLHSTNPLGDLAYWHVEELSSKKPGFYVAKGALEVKKKRFSYHGETNSSGVPHGYGTWTSEWQFGEVLSGLWDNGAPVGPFRSRECKTGSSFANLRIGIATVSEGYHSQNTKVSPLRFGVACVECSISGKFFKDLPAPQLLMDPFNKDVAPISFKTAIENVFHINDFCDSNGGKTHEIKIKCNSKGFHVSGYQPEKSRKQLHFLLNSNPDTDQVARPFFSIKDWIQLEKENEVLIFIPGFNGSLAGSTASFGQMLGLGTLPSRIKPFVFHWPGGNLLQYPQAVRAAQSFEVAKALETVIKGFAHNGFTKIHIISHSMGARVVNSAVTKGCFARIFKEKSGDSATSTLSDISMDFAENDEEDDDKPKDAGQLEDLREKIEIGSIIYINPEASLAKFKLDAFPELHRYCPVVSMYGNIHDLALRSAQYLFAGEPLMGRAVEDMKITISPRAVSPSDIETSVCEEEFEFLDMDVIDATNLENNVALDKHSYFALNKFVVDDILDTVLSGKRALQRESRLINVEGNVFSFLSAPSFVHQG